MEILGRHVSILFCLPVVISSFHMFLKVCTFLSGDSTAVFSIVIKLIYYIVSALSFVDNRFLAANKKKNNSLITLVS